jgi:glycosyltransferase involved in cell wall biosynthesis
MASVLASPLHRTKIVFVLPSLGVGGAEHQAFVLARHLVETEGADVLLVSLGATGRTAELCSRAGLPYTFFPLKHPRRHAIFKFVDLARFAAWLRRERAQVLLPYCMFPNVLCALTWRIGGARLCFWNQRDEGRERLGSVVEALAIRQVSHFVANSTHGAEFLTSVLKVPAGAVRTIHNGVELGAAERTGEAWRQALGLPADAFVACMVANLHRYKDHDTLISAWPHVVRELARHGKPAFLLLAGAFRDRYDALAQAVEQLGLQQHVRFLGEVSDVAGLLQAVDLAVFSSRAEGLPNAVLEAMAAGLAVAGTDYPGIREALGLSGTRLLASPGDAAALAARIVEAGLNPALRATLAADGRSRIEMEFTPAQMCRRMTRAIIEGLGRGATSHPVIDSSAAERSGSTAASRPS